VTPPPVAAEAAAGVTWRGEEVGIALGAVGGRLRLLALAAAVLALTIAGTLGLRVAPATLDALATRAAGTAFLGTATCADWQRAGAARRDDIVGALAVAATAPDPENHGATLGRSAAYTLFASACSTRASRSALLYEIYNRAASFQSLGSPPIVRSGGFGTAPHR